MESVMGFQGKLVSGFIVLFLFASVASAAPCRDVMGKLSRTSQSILAQHGNAHAKLYFRVPLGFDDASPMVNFLRKASELRLTFGPAVLHREAVFEVQGRVSALSRLAAEPGVLRVTSIWPQGYGYDQRREVRIAKALKDEFLEKGSQVSPQVQEPGVEYFGTSTSQFGAMSSQSPGAPSFGGFSPSRPADGNIDSISPDLH